MENLMIDLETLGVSANSVILSISAVEFDLKTGEIGRVFNANIDIDSCLKYGLKIEGETLKWWISQTEEARKCMLGKYDMVDALSELNCFINNNKYNVWGNSNRFDLNILENAYKKLGMHIPWSFRNERDVRTLVSLAPEIKENMVFEGIKHNSLDDCKHQIKYCCETYKQLKK